MRSVCRNCLVGVILAMACIGSTSAQTVQEGGWIRQSFTTSDGLPSPTIRALLQDRDGYLWIGTTAGIARYDGQHLQTFSAHELGTNRTLSITALAQSADGSIYIGTAGAGLLRYRDGHFSLLPAGNLPDTTVFTLLSDTSGTLWLSIPGKAGGFGWLDKDRFQPFSIAADPAFKSVRSLKQGPDGQVWVLTGHGLFVFKDRQLIHTISNEELKNPNAIGLLVEKDGNVVVAGQAGLTCIRGNQITYLGRSDGLETSMAWDTYRDRDGALWVGTDNGTFVKRGARFERFGDVPLFESLTPRAMLEDREGSLWMGAANLGGLHRLRHAHIHQYAWTAPNVISALLPTSDGTLWVGTVAGGVRHRDANGAWRTLAQPEHLVSGTINNLFEDSKHAIWISTGANGVDRLQSGKLENFSTANGLLNNDTFDVQEDRSQRIWIGTIMGVNSIDSGKVNSFVPPGGRPMITSLLSDRTGSLWAGGYMTKVSRLSGSKFEFASAGDSDTEQQVNCLLQTSNGMIFAATADGLSRWVKDRFVPLGEENGMPSGAVNYMTEDHAGALWLATRHGLLRITLNSLNELTSQPSSQIDLHRYGTEDGLSEPLITVVRTAPDGTILAASPHAINFLTFTDLVGVAPAPNPVIDQVLLDEVSVQASEGHIQVTPSVKHVDFRFAAPTFISAGLLRFRYRVVGYDAHWSEPTENNFASYTSLPPGNYAFEVEAQDRHGVWNPHLARVAFQVLTPFYRSTWFLLLCCLIIGGLVWAAYLLKLRRLRAEFGLIIAERTRIARDLHDTLLQGFSGSIWRLDAVTHDLPPQANVIRRKIESVLEDMERSLLSARDSIVRLRGNDLEKSGHTELSVDIGRMSKRLFTTNELTHTIEETGDLQLMADSARNEVLAVVSEVFTNIQKHARATKVSVGVIWQRGRLQVSIVDNGQGFQIGSAQGVNKLGIRGMRERITLLGGDLAIESSTHGTRVALSVPLTEAATAKVPIV